MATIDRTAADAPEFESKICPPEQLQSRLQAIAKPVVFTNGVFDILHRGHVTCLARARDLGQSLIVAINDDESVRRLNKGDDRPINLLADRLAMLAALDSTSLVTWFSQDTPAQVIDAIGPEILVKGGDWPIEQIVGAQKILAAGGQVLSIPFEHQLSTTNLLRKIRQQN